MKKKEGKYWEMKEENLLRVIKLRHELHQHPELSLQENETKRRLMEFIRCNTNMSVVDCGSWFYVWKQGKDMNALPIAFRADFDAVPIHETLKIPYSSIHEGVSHKCGHDGHSAVLAGVCLELDEMELERDCYFIFQHGEEIGQGGEECAKLIPEKGISEIYAFHNRSGYNRKAIVYRRNLTQCASMGLTIRMEGIPAHASQPEDGINPAYEIAQLVGYTQCLLESNHFEDMVLCTIVNISVGNKNFGVAASVGEVSMTIRANREEEMKLFQTLVEEESKRLGEKAKLKVSFEITDAFPETKNDDKAIDKVLSIVKSMNLETLEMEAPWRASEDFGYYTKQCKGAMFYVGNGVDYPMVHTKDYDFCDEIIPTCVDLFVGLANSKEIQ